MQEGGQIQNLPGQRLCIDWLCVGLLQENIHYAGGNVALPMYVLIPIIVTWTRFSAEDKICISISITMSIWIFLHCEW